MHVLEKRKRKLTILKLLENFQSVLIITENMAYAHILIKYSTNFLN